MTSWLYLSELGLQSKFSFQRVFDVLATVYSFVFTEGPFQGTQVTKVTRRPIEQNTFIKAVKHYKQYTSTIKNNARSTAEASIANQSHGLGLLGNEGS